jgi:hypothetical protein
VFDPLANSTFAGRLRDTPAALDIDPRHTA